MSTPDKMEDSDDQVNSKSSNDGIKKKRKKGMIYLSTIPPFMNVTKITEIMSQYGKVGRVFLQPAPLKPGKED
ncbi:hypothetical protein LSTR_LSTR016950 [Laodelphax striatellus]|uniref:RRM domain-containing protein n=1 Tax=Laodelphax striatellus TaxID=195883 RepID=A0A482XCQ1_LAOST|nr:hypothetical protein LSTR_LSTR016950 [Laodelphax striatellus]